MVKYSSSSWQELSPEESSVMRNQGRRESRESSAESYDSDMYLPLDADIKVNLGDYVKACETVIAELK